MRTGYPSSLEMSTFPELFSGICINPADQSGWQLLSDLYANLNQMGPIRARDYDAVWPQERWLKCKNSVETASRPQDCLRTLRRNPF